MAEQEKETKFLDYFRSRTRPSVDSWLCLIVTPEFVSQDWRPAGQFDSKAW